MGLLADWQIRKDIKIEPFAEESFRPGVISFGVSSYGYDVRVGRHFKVFTNVYGAVIDPKQVRPERLRRYRRRLVHHPAQQLRPRGDGRIFRDPARRPGDVPGQIDLRPLRHHRQRHAARTGMARQDHHRDQQHDAAAREDLRQRRHRPDSLSSPDAVCEKSYADKKGKYQDQKGLTLPFVVGQEPPAG